MKHDRCCASCGGPVKLVRAVIKLQRETGRVDPKTHRPVLVTKEFEGLGTWRCLSGCPKRKVTVERFTGSGAEAMKKQVEPVGVTRPIAVKFGTPKAKEATA